MLATETKEVRTKQISAEAFRKTLLQGTKVLLSGANRFKGSTKEISGRR